VGFNVAADDLGAVVEVGLVAVGYATGAMIIGRRLRGLPSVGVIAVSLTFTALVYAAPAIAGLPHTLSGRAILAVVVLGLLCTAGAFVLFFQLIAEVGPNRATVITYFNPAVAIVSGAVLLSEPITVAMLVGFALLAVGSYVGTRRQVPAQTGGAAQAAGG
jgi:drug/metabolite transporter (DMT)-like permease